MSNPQLCYEIYENILRFCDGETLIVAESVCLDFKFIVEKLGQKNIWEPLCYRDIPPDEFVCINMKLNIWTPDRWEILYRRWVAWKNVAKDVTVDIRNMNEPEKISDEVYARNITCIKKSGSVVTFGNTTGGLKFLLFNSLYDLPTIFEAPVYDIIYFNAHEHSDVENSHRFMMALYSSVYVIYDLDGELNEIALQRDVANFTYFEDFFCTYVHGILSVYTINIEPNEIPRQKKICYAKVHRPTKVLSLGMTGEEVIVLCEGKVFTFSYRTNCQVMKVLNLQLCRNICIYEKYRKIWILRDTVVCTLKPPHLKIWGVRDDKIEKDFNCMMILGSLPTCVYLHGTVLFISTQSGRIFVYNTLKENWRDFNLCNYFCKIQCGTEPIFSFDVLEEKQQTVLIIGSSNSVRYVTIKHILNVEN